MPSQLSMEAVIFTGIQGSGKTTFHRERSFDTHVRISLDLLKKRPRERRLLQGCVAAIPVPGVRGTFKRLERPAWTESFDEFYTVTHGEDASFIVSPEPRP